MITEGAKLTMSPSDGTITLTATPSDIKKVARYINEQNMRLSRQVAISVKVLQVQIADNDTYGLDLKATFKDGVNNVVVAGSTSVSTAENAANMVSWGILKATGRQMPRSEPCLPRTTPAWSPAVRLRRLTTNQHQFRLPKSKTTLRK